MTAIGGKTKTHKATQPQFVVQLAGHLNEYMKLVYDDGEVFVTWVGDPNAATKFDSKYNAKYRTRELDNVPQTRVFKAI